MLKIKASFDDGCALDLKVADLLNDYGIANAVFYIPANWHLVNRMHGDVPLTGLELQELSKMFTIGSHTITHPMLTRIPTKEALREITGSKLMLQEELDIEIEDFCYPRGYANDEIREMVRKYYSRARNTLVGNLDPPTDPVWETPTVHVAGRRRKEYEGTDWLTEALKLLETAVKRSEAGEEVVYHFWGHSWEIERYSAWGDFEKLLIEIEKVQNA